MPNAAMDPQQSVWWDAIMQSVATEHVRSNIGKTEVPVPHWMLASEGAESLEGASFAVESPLPLSMPLTDCEQAHNTTASTDAEALVLRAMGWLMAATIASERCEVDPARQGKPTASGSIFRKIPGRASWVGGRSSPEEEFWSRWQRRVG
jgi:hypothetical protein